MIIQQSRLEIFLHHLHSLLLEHVPSGPASAVELQAKTSSFSAEKLGEAKHVNFRTYVQESCPFWRIENFETSRRHS